MTPRDPNNNLQAFLKDNPCTCLPDHTTQVSHGCLRSLGFLPPSAEHHQFPCNHYTSLLPTIVSSGHLHSMLSAPSSHNRSQRASSFRSCRSFPGRVPPRLAAVPLPQLLLPRCVLASAHAAASAEKAPTSLSATKMLTNSHFTCWARRQTETPNWLPCPLTGLPEDLHPVPEPWLSLCEPHTLQAGAQLLGPAASRV